MTKKELLSKSTVLDADMNCVLAAHPLQIISEELYIPVWSVNYSYVTQRGNEKATTKYMFLHCGDWDIAEREFQDYIKKFNDCHPDRKILNVKILDMDYMGKIFILLE